MDKRKRNEIVGQLQVKAQLKRHILALAEESFELLGKTLEALADEYNQMLEDGVRVNLMRRSKRVIQLDADEDTMILSLQTNVYQFDRDHDVWGTEYVKENAARSYVAIVNIYNFLSDSFKYDRDEDMGYLVARVFINAEGAFFVEGKRQRGMGQKDFGKKALDGDGWRNIVETALKYCIEFDQLVPPYDKIMITNLAHMNLEILSSKTVNGKRLGFQFKSDDVREA